MVESTACAVRILLRTCSNNIPAMLLASEHNCLFSDKNYAMFSKYLIEYLPNEMNFHLITVGMRLA